MNYDTFKRLKHLQYINNRNEYAKIIRRLRSGTMTTYVWNNNLYYDTAEYTEKIKTGRRSKITEFEKKPVINIDEWVKQNENLIKK